MKKTIAELIDELGITNIKMALIFENPNATHEQLQKAQALNKYRSQLKNAINEYFKERTEVKTY